MTEFWESFSQKAFHPKCEQIKSFPIALIDFLINKKKKQPTDEGNSIIITSNNPFVQYLASYCPVINVNRFQLSQ